jgi:hypothetical protein
MIIVGKQHNWEQWTKVSLHMASQSKDNSQLKKVTQRKVAGENEHLTCYKQNAFYQFIPG